MKEQMIVIILCAATVFYVSMDEGKRKEKHFVFCDCCYIINKKQLIILLYCAVNKCFALSGTDLFPGVEGHGR